MSAPKPVIEGPKKGQMRRFCVKCGHMEYEPAKAAPEPEK